MKTSRNIVIFVLLGLGAIVGFLILFSAGIHADKFSRYGYGTRNLIGASPQEVGEFAQEYVSAQHHVRSGTPQILLTRSIKRADISALGLGCVGSSPTIEEPPLMLVILKGDFDFSNMLGAQVAREANSGSGYVAYAFDLWAAEPMYQKFSRNGAYFRLALNDPTLSGTSLTAPIKCPTEEASPNTLHYGAVAATPSQPPLPSPALTPSEPPLPSPAATPPGHPLPSPVATSRPM